MLKMSTKGRYGLRAMLVLTEEYGNGPVMMSHIAERESISRKYLHALLTELKRRDLVRSVLGAAERAGIEVQRATMFGGLTDASYVQLVGAGTAAIDLGFPCRFTHTPIETCDLRDVAGLIDLVGSWLQEIEAGFDFDRGVAMP